MEKVWNFKTKFIIYYEPCLDLKTPNSSSFISLVSTHRNYSQGIPVTIMTIMMVKILTMKKIKKSQKSILQTQQVPLQP